MLVKWAHDFLILCHEHAKGPANGHCKTDTAKARARDDTSRAGDARQHEQARLYRLRKYLTAPRSAGPVRARRHPPGFTGKRAGLFFLRPLSSAHGSTFIY